MIIDCWPPRRSKYDITKITERPGEVNLYFSMLHFFNKAYDYIFYPYKTLEMLGDYSVWWFMYMIRTVAGSNLKFPATHSINTSSTIHMRLIAEAENLKRTLKHQMPLKASKFHWLLPTRAKLRFVIKYKI